MLPKTAGCRNYFFPLQTANVAYFQRKIQLSGFSAYPDGWPSSLILKKMEFCCIQVSCHV
jgi:hypothetical protein